MKEFKGAATKERNKQGKTTMSFGKIKKGEVCSSVIKINANRKTGRHPEI